MKLNLMRTRTPSEAAEVQDLDVTPIMNVFVILIPFLVSMAVFTHVSIIEMSLPPNVSANLDSSQGKPKLKLTVAVHKDHFKIVKGESLLDSIPLNGAAYDFDSLSSVMTSQKKVDSTESEVIVASVDPVVFKHIVRVMDICRGAGFQKIGLSSAPQETEDK